VILWRISIHATLNGVGGMKAPARWHKLAHPIVYCAPNPATALVEVLVHQRQVEAEDYPDELQYLEIEAPDTTSIATIDPGALGHAWEGDESVTQEIGDEWLRSRRTALLRVPSVILPATWNVLFNPRHAESAAIRLRQIHRHRFHRRLFR
jgi:RES domain-containing protein